MIDYSITISKLSEFQTDSLRSKIQTLEKQFTDASVNDAINLLRDAQVESDLLQGAFEIKKVAGQINVVIHALGILSSLPYILKEGETIQYLSLGAGNTGRLFDLETTMRVAEFKFIKWQGGPESIRQNQLFKDFFELVEYSTSKEKYLYVLDSEMPRKFLNGGRSMNSVLSRNNSLRNSFINKYDDSIKTVKDYYLDNQNNVVIVDLRTFPPFSNCE